MTKLIGDLSPSDFENIIFDLVHALGLKNVVWRTPGRDGGRDIQGEWFVEDLSGHVGRQIWYVECKRYKSSVSWPTVWEKISFAESNAADVLLFTVTSSLSPQAVDEVNKWNTLRKSPIIRFWNGADIEKKLRLFPLLAIKFGLCQDPRIEIGGALLPVVNILLKYSIAAHSAGVFGISSEKKLRVLYSLADLISARLAEIEQEGVFSIAPFREPVDGFEWLENTENLEKLQVDRYAIRAMVCYLMDFFREESLHLSERDGCVFFDLSSEIPNSVFDDLYQISLLSNFEIHQEKKQLIIKAR
jgi:hypothetical protein